MQGLRRALAESEQNCQNLSRELVSISQQTANEKAEAANIQAQLISEAAAAQQHLSLSLATQNRTVEQLRAEAESILREKQALVQEHESSMKSLNDRLSDL